MVIPGVPDGLLGALDDFDDAPFGSALAVLAHDAHLDTVLVQDGPHFVGREVDVGLAVVAD